MPRNELVIRRMLNFEKRREMSRKVNFAKLPEVSREV